MSVTVGQQAPDFTLANQDGEQVTLSDLRGRKVVLVFYPFAFSGLCTDEWCAVRDRLGAFGDDTVLLGISTDPKHSLKAYKAAEALEYDLLSDFWPHGAVAESYGVFLPDRGMATRATFILDREGVVAWAVVGGTGDVRNPDDYRAAVAAID